MMWFGAFIAIYWLVASFIYIGVSSPEYCGPDKRPLGHYMVLGFLASTWILSIPLTFLWMEIKDK